MTAIEANEVRELVQSAITAISILGGAMAYLSGYRAAQALAENSASETVSQRINEGIGQGFIAGAPLAILALIIELWSS